MSEWVGGGGMGMVIVVVVVFFLGGGGACYRLSCCDISATLGASGGGLG